MGLLGSWLARRCRAVQASPQLGSSDHVKTILELVRRAVHSQRLCRREVSDRPTARRVAGANWSEHEIFGIHLAVEEALVNAIRHGNRLDENKLVRVWFRLATNRLKVEIADEGPGFDPLRLADPTASENIECPCGRGVLLMRNYMNRVEYNDSGNRVVMEKDRGDERATA